MKIPGLISADLGPAGGTQKANQNQLKKACQEFEALFVQNMFKQMRASVPDSGLLEAAAGRDIYRDMVDVEVARQAATGQNSLGIAEALYRQLAPKQADKP
ncbi:MAG: hypothetical protein Tsb0017_07980 [Geothermobacteraceae bacterium]